MLVQIPPEYSQVVFDGAIPSVQVADWGTATSPPNRMTAPETGSKAIAANSTGGGDSGGRTCVQEPPEKVQVSFRSIPGVSLASLPAPSPPKRRTYPSVASQVMAVPVRSGGVVGALADAMGDEWAPAIEAVAQASCWAPSIFNIGAKRPGVRAGALARPMTKIEDTSRKPTNATPKTVEEAEPDVQRRARELD